MNRKFTLSTAAGLLLAIGIGFVGGELQYGG
jgi:hypothetical protein